MSKIVLISCVSKKLPYRAKAMDLYTSALFRKCLQYAYSLDPTEIFILSAKHGLIKLEEEIDPYNDTLNSKPNLEIKSWATTVISQLESKTDLGGDRFIFLAGEKYRRHLMPHIKNCEVPMRGLSIGKQLQYLTRALT